MCNNAIEIRVWTRNESSEALPPNLNLHMRLSMIWKGLGLQSHPRHVGTRPRLIKPVGATLFLWDKSSTNYTSWSVCLAGEWNSFVCWFSLFTNALHMAWRVSHLLNKTLPCYWHEWHFWQLLQACEHCCVWLAIRRPKSRAWGANSYQAEQITSSVTKFNLYCASTHSPNWHLLR